VTIKEDDETRVEEIDGLEIMQAQIAKKAVRKS